MSFNAILDRLAGQPALPRRKKRRRPARFHMEPLECRALLAASFTVVDTNGGVAEFGDTQGNLADAIAHADGSPDPSPFVINFAIPLAGVQTITLTQPLLPITHPVIIDGTSQATSQGETSSTPLIDISGGQSGAINGLQFNVGGNEVKDLTINNFLGAGLFLDGTNDSAHGQGPGLNNIIQGNFIGTDASGKIAAPNFDGGILIYNSSYNLIGGLNANGHLTNGNLISGNGTNVFLSTGSDSHNYIEGNYIGTDVTGLMPIANAPTNAVGVDLSPPTNEPNDGFASNNFIGDFDPTEMQFDPNGRNIIAGNTSNGVFILGGSGNQVVGNYIGLGPDGVTPLPNVNDGVLLEDASLNFVGGAQPGAGNVISANMRDGVEINSQSAVIAGVPIPIGNPASTNNFVQGNYIGTDSDGLVTSVLTVDPQGDHQTLPLGNTEGGIVLFNNDGDASTSVSFNTIGGDDASDGSTDGTVNARNVISGNLGSGVLMIGAGVTFNTVEGNYIGTNKTGDQPLANLDAGVELNIISGQSQGPSNNTIGGNTPGAGNVISGNLTQVPGATTPEGDGVLISNASNDNTLEANTIGLKADRSDILPNGIGIEIAKSAGNTIGGIQKADANLIAGNGTFGVAIDDPASTGNKLYGNLIGVDSAGHPWGNTDVGVLLQDGATGNFVGGTQIVGGVETSVGNTIAANGIGVSIQTSANNNQVAGNLIGSFNTANGLSTNQALGNGVGVQILDADHNTVGGLTEAGRNIIVNNIADGVDISDTNGISGNGSVVTTNNFIQGNYIGIEPDGKTRLGNGGDGVQIYDAAGNTIGGVVQGAGNVISGNSVSGVQITGSAATGNTLAGNLIGTTADGKSAVITNFTVDPNNLQAGSGVLIENGATLNIVGLPGTFGRNVISGNPADGLLIQDAGTTNNIVYNYIGPTADGTASLANNASQNWGVIVNDTPGTVIGAVSFDQGGNVISGNAQDGIFLSGSLTVGSQISGDYIGTNATADGEVSNGGFGIEITSQPLFPGPASMTIVINNVVAGNLTGGIAVRNGSSGNNFGNNYIGVTNQGSIFLPNDGVGIEISNSPKNTIGGPSSTLGNHIANTIVNANPPQGADPTEALGNGIWIAGSKSIGNHVENNSISANVRNGVLISDSATGNYIGGAGQGNTITANDLHGIAIGASYNTVQANLIGIRSAGPVGTAVGNEANGVLIVNGTGNIIGTSDPDPMGLLRNIISANGKASGLGEGDIAGSGVLISGGASNTVAGNFIGTDLQGASQDGFGNDFGVSIEDSNDNVIGGDASQSGAAPGNQIKNNGDGIDIIGQSQRNRVQGNNISDSIGLFNSQEKLVGGDGIDIANGASNNFIGGSQTADGNTISNNLLDGVQVSSGNSNAIGDNRIFSNSKLGIELAPATNDTPGANNSQSPPVLEFATTGNSHRIAGSITGEAETTYILQFFAGTKFQHADGSEDDDAEKVFVPALPAVSELGVAKTAAGIAVTTINGGVCLFDLVLPDDIPNGWIIRATASDPNGNTSQFSNAVSVQTDSVGDGVSDAVEAQSPSAGISTRSLVSIPDAFSPTSSYITLSVSTPGIQIQNAWSTTDPDPNDGGPPSNTQFGLGFVAFQLTGLNRGATVIVTMTLPFFQTAPTSYWRYGPKNNVIQWYEWNWDGNPNHTGAEIVGNTIKLHLIDGALGDDDISANGIIVDPGAPGFPDPYTVTTTADDGPGSLRQAILNADVNPGSDITFDIPGSGPQTIEPLSPLPAITANVTIDGSTQPGFAGTPLVVLDGSQAGASADGLTVASGSATIQDLAINQFSGDGIHVLDAGAAKISGNYIGTGPSGKTAEGNGLYGIEIQDDLQNSDDDEGDDEDDDDDSDGDDDDDGDGSGGGGPQPGGPSTINGGNVISANTAGGIFIHGVSANGNTITNNLIGTQADGVSPLGNQGPGVVIDGGSSGNSIGLRFTGDSNTIAFNAGPGVSVLQGTGNLIEANSIFANSGLGIDLGGDGVTPNDPDDGDDGPNDLQNFPVLASAASYGGETFISGTLDSAPDLFYTIDFYASDGADPSGFGQGQYFLGSISVGTDDSGQASFDVNLAAEAPGSFITATAVFGESDTSEFSAALALTPTNPLVLIVNTTDDVNDAVPDPTHFSLREAIEAANAHPGQDIIDFDLPNLNRVILPQSPLPDITDPVIVDGASQPGYQGLPLVEIDGSQAGSGADGLRITGGGSIVRGLAIHSFQSGRDDLGVVVGGNAIELAGLGGNLIVGDFLGTDVTGTRALPDQRADLYVFGSPSNVIGGTTAAARNVILLVVINDFNSDTNQVIQNGGGNHVEGNYIGVDLTGTAALAGGGAQIENSANTIGGTAAGAGNVIVGGLAIDDGSFNIVQGNLIGSDFTGTVALGSGSVLISGQGLPAEFNQIGGSTPAARNLIAGNVLIEGAKSNDNVVQGNYIGTDMTGSVSIHGLGATTLEGDAGIAIESAFNEIGGAAPGEGNVISGVAGGVDGAGILLEASATSNQIQGNFIGTDATGTKPLGNLIGIDDRGYQNLIGGPITGEGNVISGNEEYGLLLDGAGGNMVQGNLIGTDRTGTLPLGNGNFTSLNDGVFVTEPNDVIGGAQPGAGNVISANGGDGISIHEAINTLIGASGITVQGNYIGTDITGTARLGNGGAGILVTATPHVVIGGPAPGAGNVIAANGGDGVQMVDVEDGQQSSGAIIQGNKIGTNTTGTIPLGNAGDGVSIITFYNVSTNETIGGPELDEGNTIAFNGGRGVEIPFGNGNSVRGNDIYDNGGLGLITDINGALSTYAEQRGIDLPHTAPLLTSAVFDSQGTVVSGSLTGTPFTRYEIDFFANDTVNVTGFGDGQTYLESISVLVDDTGTVQFQIPLDDAVPVGQWITATATPDSPDGNTSMFSQPAPVIAADPETIQFSSPDYLVTETGGAAVIVVTRSGSTAGIATVDYTTSDGSATAGVNYAAESGTITFADGETSKTITIPVADDALANGDNDFQLLLSNANGASLGAVAEADVTIADSDAAGQLQFTSAAYPTVDKDLAAPVFTITRTGGSEGTVTVDYRVTGGTAVGVPAVQSGESVDADYLDAFGTVTFAPGQTTAQISFDYVEVLIDNNPWTPEYRGPRTIELTLGNPTGGAVLGAVITSTLTIDDPEDQNGSFGVGGLLSSPTALESDGHDQIAVFREGQISTTESVSYTTVDGTAKAGTNYVATSGTLTFQPGQTLAFVDVPVLDDHVVDHPGDFHLALSDPTGGALIFDAAGQYDVTILDSDGPPPPDRLFVVEQSFHELSGAAVITVERVDGATGQIDNVAKGSLQVDYATSDGTAAAGTDYTATSGTLTFSPGQEYATFSVPIVPGLDFPPDATFFVTLSNLVGNAVIGGDNPATETIFGTPGQVQFASPSYSVAENNANLTITVTFTPAPGAQFGVDSTDHYLPVTVDYSTHDGTATAGADYAAVSGTLSFYPYAETSTITIPILNDLLVEANETFGLTLSDPKGGLSLGDSPTTTITILDEDSPQAVQSTTALTSDLPSGSTYGQTVTLTAVVGAASGTSTGSVDFVDTTTGQDLGSVPLAVVDGVDEASVSVSTLDVRSHTIVASYTSDNGNFIDSHDSLTQSVAPATLTVTADDKTMVFGATVPTLTDTITGFVNGDTSSVVSGAAGLSTAATAASAVGNYAITAGPGTLAADNYRFTFVNGNLSVTRATLTVTTDNQTKVYGAANPPLTDTITGFVNGDTSSVVGGAASLSTAATAASGVGNYAINVTQGTLGAANYTFAFVSGTLAVTPATLTVTADGKTKVYGSANPSLTDTVTGFVNGDTSSVVSGAATITTTAMAASGVGNYPIDVSLGTLRAANYTFAFVDGTLAVRPATLTVTPDNKTMVYGATVPALTDTISGFVNGDTPSAVSGAAGLSTTATSASGVSNYGITAAAGTLNAANYAFAFVSGTLAVTPATLTVTADGKTKVYGSANPSLTDTISGFVNGDTASVISGAATLTTSATSTSGVGNYTINVTQGTLSAANYTFAFVSATLSVTPATLTVTADGKTKVYGSANPSLTDTVTGFVNGDTSSVVSGAATLSTAASSASGVGNYTITVAAGTLGAADYTFALANGTLSVTPATLTVTADGKTKVYGSANPSLTDTVTGFVNGDTSSVVSGAATLTTSATTASGLGNYPITVGAGTLSAANYTFALANGTLSVTPATLTVTADGKTKVYGSANPSLTDTVTGFVNGDTSSVVSGAATLSTAASSASGVGNYTITVAAGTLGAADYTFALANGTLSVTPATLTVTADGKTKVYGSANPSLTDTVTGFVNGDTSSVVSGAATLTTSATTASGVGNYPITVGAGTLSAANYTFALANGTLAVTPATLTVTADGKTKVYGSANPSLTDTVTGFVNGDTSSVVSGAATITTTAMAASGVGNYPIDVSLGTLRAANYTFAFVDGTLAVRPATLTVTADNKTMVYGATVPALTDTISGFVNGDTPSAVSGAAGLSTTATSASGIGSYAITAAPGTLSAANYVFKFVNGTLTVGAASSGEGGIVATALSVAGYELGPLTAVMVATFTDGDGSLPAADFSATIDWGDGVTSAGSVTVSAGGAGAMATPPYTVSGTHTYGDEGHYTVQVGIAQSAGALTTGATSAAVSATATIHEAPLAEGTVGTPEQNYIQEIYRDLFGRQAEPSGRDFWVGLLDEGQSRAQVAYDIVKLAFPEEFQRDAVAALYEQYLGRVPDPAGQQFWTAFLYDGGTIESMSQALVSSPEYLQQRGGGTNDGFLKALFNDAFGRPIDPASLTYFEGLMADGATTADMAAIVFNSDEYHRIRVAALFEQFMDRPADAGAIAYFAGELDDGLTDELVISQLISSDEYFAKAQV